MPCEGCHAEFTVFQRKRSCNDCKRFYCSNCLSTQKRTAHVTPRCLRCAIFAKRPLLRADLLQLKPKDLIFYLQSKHISTTGCVEKDELVGLVLNHVTETDAASPSNDSSSHAHINADPTHTFNALKQSCQNFFSNITDNISDSFASFDGKSSKSGTARNANGQRTSPQSTGNTAADNGQHVTHVFEQPRVSTREIPTYASFQNTSRSAANSSTSPSTSSLSPTNTEMPAAQSGEQSRQMSPPPATINDDSPSRSQTAGSLAVSPSAMMTRPSFNEVFPAERNSSNNANHARPSAKSDCECSDNDEDEDDDEDDIDDPVAIFSERSSNRAESRAQLEVESKSPLESVAADIATSPVVALASIKVKPQTLNLNKADVCDGDESSQSSFEELGAIGGISDDSKTATTDTNSSNMEQWQLLGISNNQRGNSETNAARGNSENGLMFAEKLQVALLPSSLQQRPPQPPTAPQPVKKVVRRRSDSYLNRRRRPLSDEESSPTNNGALNTQLGDEILHEQAENEEMPNENEASGNSVEGRQGRRRHNNCKRCGKNKTNIKRHVEKMRRHLESSQMSEEDIKRELKEFLVYLEQRTKSIDYSDTEDAATTAAASSLSGSNLTHAQQQQQQHQQNLFDTDTEGIHVYGGCDYTGMDSRFINLDDFDSLKELEYLSVKQLKEVLMLNRVDYKGCCEKQELLERVERLWKNLKTCPAVDKLQTDELCKICMDAPIECVILECGHMATCTSCGKVLSECPICRQYIVRVVRFFRA